MSANNQVLIKEHNGLFYVFKVMAESWSKTNELRLRDALASFPEQEYALKAARWMDENNLYTEYGVFQDTLVKDGASVTIVGGTRL